MADLKGINLAIQTPFHGDGSVDYSRWETLIEQYLAHGMHGILLSSGTGQHAYLTEAECRRLFETGIRRIGGRSSVICQTSALNLDEVIRRSRTAQDLGADAVLVLPPFFEGPTHDDGILAFYERIDRELAIDIVGYNIPQATGIELTPSLYARLHQLEHFNYIKDSSGDIARQQALINCGGRVLNGADANAVFSFMAGCHGTIWGGANIFPRESVQLFDLVEAGRHTEALELWRSLFPVLNYCWQNDYIPLVKAAAGMMGFEGGAVRAPVCPPDARALEALESALAPLKARQAA